ncbi:MAG: hypothetical protein ACFE95_14905, partial [Candidatus Hodarchaeota archaeon]
KSLGFSFNNFFSIKIHKDIHLHSLIHRYTTSEIFKLFEKKKRVTQLPPRRRRIYDNHNLRRIYIAD